MWTTSQDCQSASSILGVELGGAHAHVGHAACKPDARARRQRDHRGASAATSAIASARSTPPVMCICGTCVKDISIVPGPVPAAGGDARTKPTGSGVTVTGTKVGALDVSGEPASARSNLHQANSMLRLMPGSRATDVTVIPGENFAATAASLSLRAQRRRGAVHQISDPCLTSHLRIVSDHVSRPVLIRRSSAMRANVQGGARRMLTWIPSGGVHPIAYAGRRAAGTRRECAQG